MSYVVSTCMAAFCHGQDHPGGVPVPVRDIAAGRAPENPFIEREAFLGSRTALSARHGGVGGRYQHHLPARPHATLDKFPFSRGDRSVRGFPRHRGPGQEGGPEALDGDGLVVVHDALGPHPGRVVVLALSLLAQLRSLAPGRSGGQRGPRPGDHRNTSTYKPPDPETCVGSAPLAHFPDLSRLPQLIRLKYATAVNRWTVLKPNCCTRLAEATAGDLSRSLLWKNLLSSYGVTDIASNVFRDQFGCWGFLDLWRLGGSPAQFTEQERAFLSSLTADLTAVLGGCQAATFTGSPLAPAVGGPVVLLLAAPRAYPAPAGLGQPRRAHRTDPAPAHKAAGAPAGHPRHRPAVAPPPGHPGIGPTRTGWAAAGQR